MERSPTKRRWKRGWSDLVRLGLLMRRMALDWTLLRRQRVDFGAPVMDNVVDSSLIDLLTKRFNPKVEYTSEAKDIFKDLTCFSGLKKVQVQANKNY